MYGWQAITAANGWSITLAGVAIVFTGLLILAVVMANMERILNFWDRKGELLYPGKRESKSIAGPLRESMQEQSKPSAVETGAIHLSQEQQQVADAFQLITRRMGEPFSLLQLLEKATQHGISNPHHQLDTFLQLNLIVEGEGELRGFYKWGRDIRVIINSADEDLHQ
jgi:Na+-transporting methylmalonyl-CoA/oxaloacetate decarboxylase gamma subunit